MEVRVVNISVSELVSLLNERDQRVLAQIRQEFSQRKAYQFHTIPEAANILKLDPRTLRKKIKQGDLQATPDNRVSLAEIEKYITGNGVS